MRRDAARSGVSRGAALRGGGGEQSAHQKARSFVVRCGVPRQKPGPVVCVAQRRDEPNGAGLRRPPASEG